MDEPNLMQNSTSISSDKKDNMTSLSSSKRTIVLGVVNTAGMKSTNMNRKRRWDQPPEDFSGTTVVKKLCLSENETLPVKGIESPETATAVIPNIDRINSQCDYSCVPNQSSVSNSAENEEISKGLSQSHSSHISNETNVMLIDLPEDKSNRLTPYEPSSDITLCSKQLENLSEVNVLETCDRLQCIEKVNSHVPDPWVNAQDDSHKAESLFNPISETKIIKCEQKGSDSATVLSHQSDELRRIMFSYDECSSDSDTTESINYKDENSGMLTSSCVLDEIDISKNKNVCINDVPQIGGSIQATTSEKVSNDIISESVASKETNLSENSDSCIPPNSNILNTPSDILLKFGSKETDAFIDNSKSLEIVGGVEESLIESQQNIPNKQESVEISNDQGDSVVSETLMMRPENDKVIDGVIHSPKSEDGELIEKSSKNDNCAQDVRDLEACCPNSDETSSRLKNECENTSLDEVIKTNQDVETVINEEIDSETIVPNQVDINQAEIEGNQIHLSVLENKVSPDDEALGDDSTSKAAFETVDPIAVPCDTGQFAEDYSARINNSDLNVEKSIWKLKKITDISNKSSNVVFKSNVESLLKVDKPCKDKYVSHISDAPCFDHGESSENVENKCKFQVATTETIEVTLNAQESIEVTNKTISENLEKLISSNAQNTIDTVRNSEAETLNLHNSKLSISKDQYSEITDYDKKDVILRSDDSYHSDTTVNTSNENIAVISAPIQELSVDVLPAKVDMSDENGDLKHFHNIVEESTSKGIPKKKNITEEDRLKDSVIYNLAPETLPLCDRESVSTISKENLVLSDSIDVNDIHDSICASKNIDPAVLEVVLCSQEKTLVDDTAREECIVSRNIAEHDLKYDKAQEFSNDEFSGTNVNVSETKIDKIMVNQEEIVIETIVEESEDEKNVCQHYEENTNITDYSTPVKHVAFKVSEEGNMITDVSNSVVGAGIDNVVESAEGEVIDQNNGAEIEVIENSEDEFHMQDSAKVYDGNSIDSNVGTEVEMNEETNKSTITAIENTETDNNSVNSTDAELGSVQTSEKGVDKKMTKIEIKIVESPKRELSTVKDTKTEASSLEVNLDTELISIDNNEIELGTEETIETEISVVENVENELCSLESDEIITVETGLNSIDSAGNIVNTEEKTELGLCSEENDIAMESSGNTIEQTRTASSDENIELNIIEEVTLNDDIPDSVFESNEVNINVEVQKCTPLETSLDVRTKTNYCKVLSKSTEMDKDTEITIETSKESVFEEEITVESSTVEECVFENSNITVIEDVVEETSIDSTSYEGILNHSPEESKDFVDSFDVSETVITDETPIGDNLMLEPIENEVLIEDETKTVSQEVDISDKLGSPAEVSSEIYVEENIDDPKSLTDDIESFVVEEVVTCESPGSDKGVDYELASANKDMPSSPSVVLEETCGTTVAVGINDQLNAVIKENTVDLEVSTNDNQNKVITETNLYLNNSDKLNVEKSSLKHIVCNKELKNEPLLNSIRSSTPLLEMECETSVDSITETAIPFKEEEMQIGEQSFIEMPEVRLKRDSIKVERTPASVLNPENDVPSVVKHIGINVPLLKTVTNSVLLRKEKPPTPVDEISRFGNIPVLEPITLRIYKDNLSVKTDDLDSPKKTKSPKLSSELKSQLSPHFKSSESRSSLSPSTKKLEFTLKIAKDVNTNVPRATMSPKNNISPSSIHKSGDILRAELTGEGGRSSSPYISSDPGTNKVKLKVPKQSPPGIPKEYNLSHMQGSNIKEEMIKIKEKVIDPSAGVTLPKPPIEIGTVFKKMMETEKSIDSKSGISVLDQSHNSSNPVTPIGVPVVKKRGRPRKILHKVLTMAENESNIHSNLIASCNQATPLNHSAGASPALDISSGAENSEQISSRQVRSCRARTKPIVVKTRKPRGGGTGRGGMRGRGGVSSTVGGIARTLSADKDPEKLVEKLSEREKAELAKIEERKRKYRLENIARNEAKKAKKLAQKLRDEERRQRKLREKAEKAEAAAPQVFEEETRMSAPDGGSRGHTPAPSSALSRLNQTGEHEESQNSISTPTSSQIKRGRMEIPIDPECKEVRVEQLAEYQWQGSELYMIQEQVSMYLGVKSFKRKYPDLKRRPVEAEERTFLEDSGLVTKSMCDLGLTAVSSAEVLDIMYQDFPEKYEEFRRYVREKQAKEASFKQKTVFANLKQDKSKGEPREQALEAVAMWNSNLNRERREERRCALDLQTFTVHYPRQVREKMSRPLPKCGMYPVSLLPGQFSDFYKVYTPTELHYFPLNTVMYGPLKPNERQPINPSDGSGSDISSSSTSDDSSGSSSSDSESEDEGGVTRECKICNGEKKTNKESHPEILLQCSSCKGLCHPTCQEITPEMLPHIKKYNWHCSNCKKCMQCKNATKDDKMLFCDLCDRGYHIHCVGLRKAPEGRWHCSVCSFCTLCGSKDPGGPEWDYEYKKTDKGVRLYQRTLCVPCSKNALM